MEEMNRAVLGIVRMGLARGLVETAHALEQGKGVPDVTKKDILTLASKGVRTLNEFGSGDNPRTLRALGAVCGHPGPIRDLLKGRMPPSSPANGEINIAQRVFTLVNPYNSDLNWLLGALILAKPLDKNDCADFPIPALSRLFSDEPDIIEFYQEDHGASALGYWLNYIANRREHFKPIPPLSPVLGIPRPQDEIFIERKMSEREEKHRLGSLAVGKNVYAAQQKAIHSTVQKIIDGKEGHLPTVLTCDLIGESACTPDGPFDCNGFGRILALDPLENFVYFAPKPQKQGIWLPANLVRLVGRTVLRIARSFVYT